MVQILSIDTTMELCSVAIFKGNEIFFDAIDSQGEHSHKILPLIQRCLKISKSNLKEIDLLACANGPGNFSGTRISVCTIQGISIAMNIPVVSFSSPMVIAQGLYRCFGIKEVVIYLRINREKIHRSYFRLIGSKWIEDEGDKLCSLEEIMRTDHLKGRSIFCKGYRLRQKDDLFSTDTLIDDLGKRSMKEKEKSFPNAKDVILLAYNAWKNGTIELAEEIFPNYFKDIP
ncbi:tRNA (adenosine(37)-N6)-threonylcarbamoyltransferase complex dimerization subunit type 1 TsaB [Candidatus Riesia pediculischaeffi]|uniref:tRNA threonylcarbamoyladenosine biosynthesis protein TsaB n=1 Tax=Candidatus Riesia pediculischaeffi TaxID=428411 RepID=A0A1V0HKI1_9ENTR|nr:tRNA (adenosine(37)-N6)-threonylcarbamoyltransferase complex dimerization subunit type 1 TsaB [Candidatus Riesia pediculischaeffi]ARC53340.1 hypothetical protein AOQ87_01480 [Candidatus Riesia pediculischaeffi]